VEAIFRLKFLGAIQIERNGKPVRGFRSRKALALLGYLAAQNQPVPREQLADLFWENKPEATGRANLSWSLNKLASRLPGCLHTDRHTVEFQHSDSYWLDVDAFAALEAQKDVTALAAAVELARGEFMSGLDLDGCAEFGLWLVGERERWRQRVARILDELVAHHSRRGEHPQSLHFAQHLLTLEPWREETHRQVMRLLARSGQHSAALAQYQACCRTLTQELGFEPTEATTALYERIRAASAHRASATSSVPAQPTPFVGREQELAKVIELLDNPDCRLLTITGPGGIGKTRLALQAAAARLEAFLEGIYFVSLTDASCIGSLVSVIADALDLSFSGQDPQVQLVDYLREKQVLLILDSFEHLLPHTCAKEEPENEEALGGVRLLAEILQKAPEVKLLVTSRQRLNLSWEWSFEVEGLEYPNRQSADSQDWASYSAVQLFLQAARRVHRDLTLSNQDRSAIVRICELVEGLPLGIELASAWVRTHTCEEIAREIETNLGFLATSLQDVPDRHRSARATFEHSWRLLTLSEQDILMKLSVFHRGFSRQAAHEIAGASQAALESLVDKSLLRSMPPGRYDLHELLRQYAAEKLSAAPELQSAVADRHCAYYLALLQRHEADLATMGMAQALLAIKTESENVRAAWCWAATQTKLDEIERSVNSLSRFYTLAGPYQEGEATIRLAVEHTRTLIEKPENSQAARAILSKLLAEQAHFLNGQGMHSQAITAAQASIAASETASRQAEGHLQWGQALWYQRDYQAAQAQLERALVLARSAQLPRIEADSLNCLGKIRWHLSDYAGASAYIEQALSIFHSLGDRKGEGESLISFGRVCAYQDDYAGARNYFEQALRVLREIGDRPGESLALVDLGLACNVQGDYTRARACYQEALGISREIGDRSGQSLALINLGYVLDQSGDYVEARTRYRQTMRISRETGDRQGESFSLACLCLLSHHQGDDQAAREFGQHALTIAEDIGNRHVQGYALTRLGHALEGLGHLAVATEAYQQALALRRELNQANLAMEPLAGLARVELAQGHLAQARAYAAEILDRLGTGPLYGADEPFRVYQTCYRVLEASQENSRAQSILSEAHNLLQERAARIRDEKLRRSFLENVTIHREIVEAMTLHRES
jgi:predicted ATPase/DNA-binding SARP family transcriptional activator